MLQKLGETNLAHAAAGRNIRIAAANNHGDNQFLNAGTMLSHLTAKNWFSPWTPFRPSGELQLNACFRLLAKICARAVEFALSRPNENRANAGDFAAT